MAPSGNRGKKNSVEADQMSPLSVSQQGGEKNGDQKSGRSGSSTEKTANLPPWETGIRGSSWRPNARQAFLLFRCEWWEHKEERKKLLFHGLSVVTEDYAVGVATLERGERDAKDV